MIHAVYDLTGCTDPQPAELLAAMRATVALLGCTIFGELAVDFPEDGGVTCVLVLGESHLTVSTWPEHGLAHLDIFTCRADTAPDEAVAPILLALAGTSVSSQRVPRLGPPRSVGCAPSLPRRPARRA